MTLPSTEKEGEENISHTNGNSIGRNPVSEAKDNSVIKYPGYLTDQGLKNYTTFQSPEEEIKYYGEWADFWRYSLGVNVIPAHTRMKKPIMKWKKYQDDPIPTWQHQQCKDTGNYNNGMAVVLGKIWHREDRKNLFLVCLDIDKRRALEELCKRNGEECTLEDMAQDLLIEQHKADPNRAHIYFYSPIPFPSKAPDSELGLEIKERGLSMCSPSIHRSGHPYQIIGTREPVVLTLTQATQLLQDLKHLCVRSGVKYLQSRRLSSRLITMIKTFRINPSTRIPKGERHPTLISLADSLLIRHLNNKSEQDLKEFFLQVNATLCDPEPLSEPEVTNVWDSAMNFVQDIKCREGEITQDSEKVISTIEEASEYIKRKYRFVTVEQTKDILYYSGGVYVSGGEVLIEKEVELRYGYGVSNKQFAEIKGHIMRSTYRNAAEFDSDINIINLMNGLYDINQGRIKEHTPDYFSLNQKPILYDPKAKPKRFGPYLQEVLYPSEIRTAVEVMAYTFHRDNPLEIITDLLGYGSNGKSVFISLLTFLHGTKNVSNVSLSALLDNRFALSDLENKNVNFDTEVSSNRAYDSAILKKLTGKQPVRIERKNQEAYDTKLYAKFFFSANAIPQTTDDSDAYYRRRIMLSFPNQFEGQKDDPCLLDKLTNKEELSGIFNGLMIALRTLLRNKCIFVRQKTIQERRDKYELAVNPIDYFKKEAIAEDSVESDTTRKEDLYRAYEIFVKEKNLPILKKENFGKFLIHKRGFQDGREPSGKRKTFWRGVRLTENYSQIILSEQQTLTA